MTSKKLIEIHMLQALPTNAINCGGSGEIKMVGDRQRISSQAWKRPARIMLNEIFENRTIHTRSLEKELSELLNEGVSEDNIKSTIKLANSLVSSEDAGNGVMAKYSTTEINFIKNLARSGNFARYEGKNKKTFSEDLKNNSMAIGIALFGRMFANANELDAYAAIKYSHSYSTHPIEIEDDYFTAVDDLTNNGAGHIDSKSYTSAVHYRYVCLDVAQLEINLGRAVTEIEVKDILIAVFLAFPTGKENAMYCRTRPEYIKVTVRSNNMACTACAAFERGVRNTGNGFLTPSIEAIQSHFKNSEIGWEDEYLSNEEFINDGAHSIQSLIENTVSKIH